MTSRPACGPDCECCTGTRVRTPAPISNPAGRPTLAYRAGTHPTFKEALLAGLSGAAHPALQALTTREDADLTVALCDALATTLDVLTFYQERIAHEHYLRTAVERRSLVELSRLIGYEPAPGVAAAAWLAFAVQQAAGGTAGGAGAPAPTPVPIPAGTRVQSVPGPDEQAKTFETVELVTARAAHNALPAQVEKPWRPARGDTDLHLQGVGVRLDPGDAILIVGAERRADPGSERWEVRVVETVQPDTEAGRTRVTWADPLGHHGPTVHPPGGDVTVHAFRKRSALFGHNAPDPRLLDQTSVPASGGTWEGFEIDGTHIDLDQAVPGVTVGSWVALVSNEEGFGSESLPGYVELYRAQAVRQVSRTDFGLSGRITRVTPDTTEHLDPWRYGLRETLVLAESEPLATAPRRLTHPVQGDTVPLATRVDGLTPGRWVAVSGKRQRIAVAPGVSTLEVVRADGTAIPLAEGDVLTLTGVPAALVGGVPAALTGEAFAAALASGTATLQLVVTDRDGTAGTLRAPAAELRLAPADPDAPTLAEVAQIATTPDAITADRDRTTVRFDAALTGVYDRTTVRINANVAPATHGEGVQETLGDGDAGRADQVFALRQSPLTHVSADTPSGRESTLEIRVNEVAWSEVDTLYDAAAGEQVYQVRIADDGTATVRFGDGANGARLPSGTANVRASYRTGVGVDGNLAADRLTTLLQRPAGVGEVTNPAAATGGEDPEAPDRLRGNAPLTVLTLDRAVSVQDYEDFARAFAGIDKAHALWVPAGPGRGVFVTVAGVDGAPIPRTGQTHRNLLDALRTYGDPLIPIRVVDHRPVAFTVTVTVKVHPAHDDEVVVAAVEAALRSRFAFSERAFGQPVTLSEVTAVAHDVDGAVAAHVVHLHLDEAAASGRRHQRLTAAVPVASLSAIPEAAELLTLTTEAIRVEVMA